MPLISGTRLGRYEVQAPLGAGGMGEVYRARDTRLNRDVALKILPPSLAGDAERLRRFEQESRAVAALNHPSILAIFDVGQSDRSPFLVTELLEGEPLRATLDRGPIPQRKVIQYGVQIADGLAVAHEKGIVHRDLKPENLFITRDGRAKILDFGLAKVALPVDAQVDPDLTSGATSAGVVMGTAGYMAPEQVRGEAVDPRTDIFALGAVLFEMLSGRRAFHLGTSAETMTAVLRDEVPEFTDPSVQISPALERIIRRCLEKDPAHRFQSARDLSFAMGVLSGGDASGSQRAAALATSPRAHRSWLWIGLMIACLPAVAAAAWFLHPADPVPARMEFAISVSGEANDMMLSADGQLLAYVAPDNTTAVPMLFVQRVGAAAASELPGTEGSSYPFFSPDDRWIGFFANGKLQKIPVGGGPPQMITPVTFPRGGSWGNGNVIIYSPDPSGPLWKVNADGSNAAPLTDKIFDNTVDSHRWPLFLPDGNHFLFLGAKFGSGDQSSTSAIMLSSLDGREVKKILVHAKSSTGYGAGHLFYLDDKEALRAVSFDPASGALTGDSRLIADVIGYQPSVYYSAFTTSLSGTLIYSARTSYTSSRLTWFDRSGKSLGTIGQPGLQANPNLSPDGSRVALDITDLRSNNLDVWIEDTKRATNTRFTFDAAEETGPIWSRDGKEIAYRSLAGQSTTSGIDLKDAAGLAAARPLIRIGIPGMVAGPQVNMGADIIPNSWSADDKLILCSLQNFSGGSRGSELIVVPASGGTGVPLLNENASESNGQISPDGKWVAYASNESGEWEIYVTTFPGAAGKFQVSRGGGSEPRWRGDGKEIFYLSPTGMLMAASVSLGMTFSSGTPAPLFQVRGRTPISSTDDFTYDVTRDGQRFIVNEYLKPQQIEPLVIVQNAVSDPRQ